MNIDGVKNGLVLDHITAGKSMEIYKYLDLEHFDNTVAIMKNVRSSRTGRKDIIKIEGEIEVNLDVLGYIDPGITVNIVKDGKVVAKKALSLPEKIVNVVKCKNPRCITSVEQELDHVFKLTDADKKQYRCIYCDSVCEHK